MEHDLQKGILLRGHRVAPFLFCFLLFLTANMFFLIGVKAVNLTELDFPPVAISVFVRYAEHPED